MEISQMDKALIINILSYLDNKDKYKVGCVSKQMQLNSSHPCLWR